MSRLDQRTRTTADVRDFDVPDFFASELPTLIDDHFTLAVAGAKLFDPQPLAITTESGQWILALSGESMRVARGSDGATSVRMEDADLRDFLNDLTTLQMLKNLNRLHIERGSVDELAVWETILRSLLDTRQVYTPGSIVLTSIDGTRLDVARTFSRDDHDVEIAHFLAEAGFLHLRGWLDAALMEEIAADIDAELRRAAPDDGSWWATMRDGSRQPVRLVNFEDRSAAAAELMSSDTFSRLCRLTDDGYAPTGSVEALNKPLDVISGTSDIPWHHDCALGMHSYNCCTLVIGVSVTDGGPGSGQLSVVPGSHRALMPKNRLHDRYDLPPVTPSTKAGDVTVHCSCLMHRALVPTDTERMVLYTGLKLPDPDSGVQQANERVLKQRAAVTSPTD